MSFVILSLLQFAFLVFSTSAKYVHALTTSRALLLCCCSIAPRVFARHLLCGRLFRGRRLATGLRVWNRVEPVVRVRNAELGCCRDGVITHMQDS
jgi:hypothetical protein